MSPVVFCFVSDSRKASSEVMRTHKELSSQCLSCHSSRQLGISGVATRTGQCPYVSEGSHITVVLLPRSLWSSQQCASLSVLLLVLFPSFALPLPQRWEDKQEDDDYFMGESHILPFNRFISVRNLRKIGHQWGGQVTALRHEAVQCVNIMEQADRGLISLERCAHFLCMKL